MSLRRLPSQHGESFVMSSRRLQLHRHFQNNSSGTLCYHHSLVTNGQKLPGRADIYISKCYTGLFWYAGRHCVFMGNVMETLHGKGKEKYLAGKVPLSLLS